MDPRVDFPERETDEPSESQMASSSVDSSEDGIDEASEPQMPPPVVSLKDEKDEVPTRIKAFRPISDFLCLESANKMVKVCVGSKRKAWTLNEELLCDRSDYFRAAFQGGFKEATEKELYLNNISPRSFAMFVDWVYGRELCYEYVPYYDNKAALALAATFEELYYLADFLGIEMLMNLTIDMYSSLANNYGLHPRPQTIDFVYKNFPENSLFRKYIAKTSAYHLLVCKNSMHDMDSAGFRDYPDYTLEVLKATIHYNYCTEEERRWPRNEPYCNYHTHYQTEKCRHSTLGLGSFNFHP